MDEKERLTLAAEKEDMAAMEKFVSMAKSDSLKRHLEYFQAEVKAKCSRVGA